MTQQSPAPFPISPSPLYSPPFLPRQYRNPGLNFQGLRRHGRFQNIEKIRPEAWLNLPASGRITFNTLTGQSTNFTLFSPQARFLQRERFSFLFAD